MKELVGSRCLVTGGAGFIGSTIVDQLLAAGASEVRIVDNFVRGSWGNLESSMERGGTFRSLRATYRNQLLVEEITEGVDYVFHQAALRITRCAEAPSEAVEVLINGTLNVALAALKHKVKKIVAASSASVYGEPSYLPMDEVPSVQQPDDVRGRQDRHRANPAIASRHVRPVLCGVPAFQCVRSQDGYDGRLHRSSDSLAGCNRCR